MSKAQAQKHPGIHSVALMLMRSAPPHEMASHSSVANGLAELHGGDRDA